MNRLLLTFSVFASLASAQATLSNESSKPASISGMVRELSTGAPLASIAVFLDRGTPKGLEALTDSEGRYSFPDVAPGQNRITAEGRRVAMGFPPYATKTVDLLAGQALQDLRLSIATNAELSGKVVDQNKEPVAGAMVLLVGREYSLGALRYVYGGLANTDDEGKYSLSIRPGRAFLLMAVKRTTRIDAVSDAPTEVKLRKPAYAATYYPGVPNLEAATPFAMSPGEKRDGFDLRLLRSPSYCIEGVAQGGTGADGLMFNISDRQPTSGAMGDGAMFIGRPSAKTGPDGKLRVCGLYPGTYTLMVNSTEPARPSFYGNTEVTVVDRDVRNVVVTGQPAVAVTGEVVWHGEAPDPPMTGQIGVYLQPMTRPPWTGEKTDALVSLPGQFSMPSMLVDSYAVRINRVPKGVYVKEVAYAGQNLLAEPLRVGGSGIGDTSLRIVLGRDGGTIASRVADKDGNAVADARVLVMPVSVASEAALSAGIVSGQCDQAGSWTSNALAPGKYYVLALERPHDNSPESISKLWAMRTRFKEVELGPRASLQVTLAPMGLE